MADLGDLLSEHNALIAWCDDLETALFDLTYLEDGKVRLKLQDHFDLSQKYPFFAELYGRKASQTFARNQEGGE